MVGLDLEVQGLSGIVDDGHGRVEQEVNKLIAGQCGQMNTIGVKDLQKRIAHSEIKISGAVATMGAKRKN